MKCQNCGADRIGDSNVCSACGTAFTGQENVTPNGNYDNTNQGQSGGMNQGYNQNPYNQYGMNQGYNPNLAGNGKARTAMILGIISLFCAGFILGVIAIIFGSIALSEQKRNNGPTGQAIAGLVLGIIGVVGWVFAMFMLPDMLAGMF